MWPSELGAGTLVDPTEEFMVPLSDYHYIVGLHAPRDHYGGR